MVNPVHRVHVSVDRPGVLGPPWTNAGADNGHGGALTGAHRRGRKMERESRGARLRPHRSSGGGVATGRRRWHEEVMGNSVARVSDAGEERRRAR